MKDTQLAVMLRSLTKIELREFGNFIRSPYFNKRSEVVRFYEAIKNFYPEFRFSETDRKTIFIKVYPGKKLSDALMRKLFSLTTNFVLDFLTINSFRENKQDYSIKMLDKLREKKLTQAFEKKSYQFTKVMDSSPHSIIYQEAKYKFTSIVNGHYLNTDEKSMVSKMQNELDDFMEYFFTVVFLFYIRLGEWSRNLNLKTDLKFFDEAVNYFESNKPGKANLALLYYIMLMLLTTEDEKYYYELHKSRNEFERHLSPADDFNISVVSMQYCHKRVMMGDTEYRKHQFEITKKILKNNLIPEGFVDPYFFTNTVRNASSIKEFQWSEKFIEDYNKRLNPDIADKLVDYSYAMIEFGKGNFENSLKLLSTINADRSNIKLDIRNLQIMNYYELNYLLELESLIDSYKHFLGRDKTIASKSKAPISRFLNFVSVLVKIKQSKNKKSAYLLKKEIENEPYFNLKEWLLKKAGEMM